MKKLLKCLFTLIFRLKKVDTLKIDKNEYIIIYINDYYKIEDLVQLKDYVNNVFGERKIFICNNEIKLETLKISEGDIINVIFDRNDYLLIKSMDEYEDISDRIKEIFKKENIFNLVIYQPDGVDYTIEEKEFILRKLKEKDNEE